MDTPLVIRPATPGDYDAIARVWFESAHRMDGAPHEMPTLRQLRERVDDEVAAMWELYVAEFADAIVAILALIRQERILDQIFVQPDLEGRGIGTALLDHAKQTLVDGFTLRAASANARACRFYQSRGLHLIGRGVHPAGGWPVCYFEWSTSTGHSPDRDCPSSRDNPSS